jgi:hypothetical protein
MHQNLILTTPVNLKKPIFDHVPCGLAKCQISSENVFYHSRRLKNILLMTMLPVAL